MSFSRSRRKFLKAGAAVAAAGALGVVGDGTFFEANRPKVVSIEIPLSRLPQSWDGLRIAQLSDLHYDPHFSAVPIAKAVDLVNGLQARPDRGDRRLCYRSILGESLEQILGLRR